jgi:hypothetical protein
MAVPMSPQRLDGTFPGPSPALQLQPDRSLIQESRGAPGHGPEEVPNSNEPLGLPDGTPREIP